MSLRPMGLPPVPEQTVRVARAAFPQGSLAIRVRDRLGEVFTDEPFAEAFGVRGAPGLSPGMLSLVTVLQFAENLTDRQAAAMAIRAIDWKYALGLELTDTGFDHSVLPRFRARLVGNGMERVVFDRLLEYCVDAGLVATGGKQRTDSTHVVSAVRDLNRLELAGESVRAALEALSVAAPDWLARAVDVPEFAHRYGPRVDSWKLPGSKVKRDQLSQVYGQDALRLCRAVWSPDAPAWLREIGAVDIMRQVLVQTYTVRTSSRGKEVVSKREADEDGVPPGHLRLASPYDTDARWSAKGDDLFWLGYKVHLTESCDNTPPEAEAEAEAEAEVRGRPNLITDVTTTLSTVPDVKATAPIQQQLADRGLPPAEHYLDSGYPSAELIETARSRGTVMVTPVLLDRSAQAKSHAGYDKSAFRIDWKARRVRCPQGNTSTGWHPVRQRERDAIVVEFAKTDCQACPVRPECTSARRGNRMLTLYPEHLHTVLAAARAEQKTKTWKDKYALRAGVEGTINQALDITGIRRARYRGLPKVRLQHAFSATAINVVRLDAHWTEHPLDRSRTSNLTRLSYRLTA
ncbi:IS1182 family transposase [Streptomyces sp. NBC_01221]|uniref:IS1182 family transposase n=1 Tax=Streptomyces sp. NBC_01221 TaxID=2903782 RepID=UPI00225ACEB2|nr:IS1182 family transposase [Streptomyces sp. NBC_01221]MCX4784730.1 IS1182 family transposase [Streptomyces sp. NBC_01221]